MDQLDRLSFGYERKATSSIDQGQDARSDNMAKLKAVAVGALCYPSQVRPRGCEFLLYDASSQSSNNSSFESLPKLPCVTDGACPYKRFRCANGHEWNAVAGSPVCFQCPYCPRDSRALRSILGLKTRRSPNKRAAGNNKPEDDLLSRMHAHAAFRNGTCLTVPPDPSADLQYKSSVLFQCAAGHTWSTSVTNVLNKQSWCRVCNLARKQDFAATAARFNGKFLGFASMSDDLEADVAAATVGVVGFVGGVKISSARAPSYAERPAADMSAAQVAEQLTASFYKDGRDRDMGRPRRQLGLSQLMARWQCERGHVFLQSTNNIRRKAGGGRRCSWCPQCAKSGLTFEWTAS